MLKFYDEIPVKTTRNGRRKAFVAELKTNPGRWAEYPDGPHSPNTAALMKKSFPGTEVTKRGDRVFARWVGTAKPAQQKDPLAEQLQTARMVRRTLEKILSEDHDHGSAY